MARRSDAVFEELEDAPADRQEGSAQARRGELYVGAILLLLLALVAGLDWWQGQARLASYRQGQELKSQNRWEEAEQAFLAAQDYGDASAQAKEVRQKIDLRDSTYASALSEAERGEWALAARDLHEVLLIQPGFRDSDARLQEAEEEVLAEALQGSIALRPEADQPGLYWYGAERSYWLEGSDANSQIHGSGNACCVIYDVPDGGTRRLVMGRFMSNGMSGIWLDPALAEYESFTWDDRGVLAQSVERQRGSRIDPRLERVRSPYMGVRVAYQAYTAEKSTILPQPETPNVTLAIIPATRQQIVGNYARATEAEPQTELSIVDFEGVSRPLAVRPGVVQAVWLSPDKRYLLIDEFSPLDSENEVHRLMVLDLKTGGANVALRVSARTPVSWETNWFSVAFVQSGPFAGQALVRGNPSFDQELRLLNPARSGEVRTVVDLNDDISSFIVHPLESGLLITLTEWTGVQVNHVYLDANGQALDLRTLSGNRRRIDWAEQRGERLVFSLSDNSSFSGGSLYSVMSLALLGPGSSDPNTGEASYSGEGRLGSLRVLANGSYWSAGPELLASLHDGRLHATTYDGSIDLPILSDITMLYRTANR